MSCFGSPWVWRVHLKPPRKDQCTASGVYSTGMSQGQGEKKDRSSRPDASVWLVLAAGLGFLFLLMTPQSPSQPFSALKEVKWGIIGCGDVTEKKSGPALSLIPDSTLVMVMRRNATLAQDYAKRHNVAKWTSDAAQLINDPDVNAVYIATPPRYHVLYALQVAAAGKPAYVEKPMGLTQEEGREAVEAFRSRGLPLFVAYYRRAMPYFLKVKSLIDSGEIGAVRTVTLINHRPPNPNDLKWKAALVKTQSHGGIGASLEDPSLKWRTDPAVGGEGGYFRDIGSHQLDLLQFWLGTVASISGQASNQAGLYPASDTVTAQFSFASGAEGTGSWCFAVGKAADQEYTEISGTKGRIRLHFFSSTKLEWWNETGRTEVDIPNPKHVQQPLLETVVAALRGTGECGSTGETALTTSLLMDTIVKGGQCP